MANKNRLVQGEKLRGADKVARIPIKVVPSTSVKRKPPWIRAKAPTGDRVRCVGHLKRTPCLEFVGRDDDVNDLCGEKLHSAFVSAELEGKTTREGAATYT